MRIWLPVVVGLYGVLLGVAWVMMWKWRKLSADWRGVAKQWECLYHRQHGIAEGLQAVCRGVGLDITIHEKADGVDIFVTHPPQEGQETRH